MKRLKHPNVTRLFEVLDDDHNDKLYLILEYVEKVHTSSHSSLQFAYLLARFIACSLAHLIASDSICFDQLENFPKHHASARAR
jgi:serine/threonine protein kinase